LASAIPQECPWCEVERFRERSEAYREIIHTYESRPAGDDSPDLLAACQAQHEALDRLFAMLIVLTREHTPDDVFFPTKSGQPWEACQMGVAAIDKAGGKRR
jgi:hypothetical protein